uniref:Small ribosomal subunit protein uS3m n=1 Tax=Blastocladiella sp. TaxID=2169676 RepID=A0A890JI55_9FUNG|nr:ribosomal protein S3 [Blastocladiella sp.]
MGRHIKRSHRVHNTQALYFTSRRIAIKMAMSTERKIRKLIEYTTPLNWGIGTIEYHSGPNGILRVIITSTKMGGNFLGTYVANSIRRATLNGIIPKVEFQLRELPYNYLDPSLLAKTIAGNKGRTGENLLGDMKKIEDHILKNYKNVPFEGEKASTSKLINGIRIEIKGITGKMTMSKKTIKNFGTLKFNSDHSIIDFGEARNFNTRGILGVKVWISYHGGE